MCRRRSPWHDDARVHTPLDGTVAQLEASDADVVQEPPEQPDGVRDCAIRDAAGTMIRIQELS